MSADDDGCATPLELSSTTTLLPRHGDREPVWRRRRRPCRRSRSSDACVRSGLATGLSVLIPWDIAALGKAAAVTREFHSHLMFSGWGGLVVEQRVATRELPSSARRLLDIRRR